MRLRRGRAIPRIEPAAAINALHHWAATLGDPKDRPFFLRPLSAASHQANSTRQH